MVASSRRRLSVANKAKEFFARALFVTNDAQQSAGRPLRYRRIHVAQSQLVVIGRDHDADTLRLKYIL
jgi:hypothetical protein